MNHRIEQKEAFQIIGWKRHMTCYSEIDGMEIEWAENAMTKKVGEKYASHPKGDEWNIELPASDVGATDGFVYVVGCIYNGTQNVDGYEISHIPGGKYAVFPVPEEHMDDVGHFKGLIHEFFPTAGYQYAGVELEHIKGDNRKIEVSFLVSE